MLAQSATEPDPATQWHMTGNSPHETAPTDWAAWHEPYTDPGSALSRRLAVVRAEIGSWLDSRPEGRLTVVSVCAGRGDDVLGVLEARPADARRVSVRLVELDPRNARAAASRADRAGLTATVEVREADAGALVQYEGAVPADLVILAGVFGNIADTDIRRTIDLLPQLAARGARIIWTRSRRQPDLTPRIRGWFTQARFHEIALHAPDDALFTVGVHRSDREPEPLDTAASAFRFVV